MDDILNFMKINQLKKVYRMNSVENRKESSAEHSWSSLMLADYFLFKLDDSLDRLKIYELLMYHDVVEIKTGDIPLTPNNKNKYSKEKIELDGAKMLKDELPKLQGDKFLKLFLEFENNITIEAKFANAIDKLDAVIHELDYKEDWLGWSADFLVEKKERYFREFPIILEEFNKILKFMEKNNYFKNKVT